MTVAQEKLNALDFISNKYNFMYQSDMTALDKANTKRLVASGIGSFKYDAEMEDFFYVLSVGEEE